MEEVTEWSVFYEALNRLGPRLLKGVHPDLEEWLTIEAKDTDSFWSEFLHGYFDLWVEGDKREAARHALEQWTFSVKQHFREILGPWSLIPFDEWGISKTKRRKWKTSIEKIQLKLDDEHLSMFIDSVRLDFQRQQIGPELLVQGVIVSYADNCDGKLVWAIVDQWHMIVSLLRKDWSLAHQIPYDKWEELVAAAFDRAGFDEVVLTPRSGDHGRDVIAIKNGIGSIRIIDSVKAFKPGHLVRHDDVRALAGVLLGDPQASKGIVTTTSGFAPGIANDPFLKPLMPYRLELMDGKALQKWFEDLALS